MTKSINTNHAMLRYSTVQFLLWMQFCCCTSFATVYMNARGVNNAMVGISFAAGNLLAFLIQPFISQIADRGRKITITQMAIIMYLLMFLLEGAATIKGLPVAVITLVYALMFMILQNTPVVVNGLGIYYIDRGAKINYGISRGLGSISFSLLSIVIGQLVGAYSFKVIPIVQMVLAFATALALNFLPSPRDGELTSENRPKEEKKGNSYLSFVKNNPYFMVYFLGMSLIIILYSFYNNFTINIVENVGAGSEEMGVILAIAGIAEVPTMFIFDYLARKIEVKNLLMIAALGFLARGAFMTLGSSATSLYVASVLQFLGFALYMPGMVRFSDTYFKEGDKNKAQGLLQSAMSFGAVIGSMVGGPMIDVVGIGMVMKVMLLVSVIGAVIAVSGLKLMKGSK